MFRCPVCGAAFLIKEQLDVHCRRVHKSNPSEYIQYHCPGCQKSVHNYETIRKHIQVCAGAKQDAAQNAGLFCSTLGVSDEDFNFNDEDLEETMDIEEVANLNSESEQENSAASDDEEDQVYQGSVLTAEEALQSEVTNFLLHIKEDCNATQSLISEVITGVNKILSKVLSVVQKLLQEKAGATDLLTMKDVCDMISDLKLMSIFEGMDSQKEMIDLLHKNHGLVEPQKITFKGATVIQNQRLATKDVKYFYQVPFLPQLERLLCCKCVLHCVDNPIEPVPSVYSTLTHGMKYQNHEVKLAHGNVLSFTLYHDGVEVVDSCSSRQGKHNMIFFYWTLNNIYPELRSTDKTIQLYAIVKTEDLKFYGYKKIMKNFLDGIIRLSSQNGVDLNINGSLRNFHGLLQAVAGDTPAQAAIGGFKESVSAEKPCRECYASNEANYLSIPDIGEFPPRNKQLHLHHLAEIDTYMATPVSQRGLDPSVKYGVNSRSVLLDLNDFDPTKDMPQDILHIAHEGVLEYTCRLVLKHVVLEEKQLSIQEVNARIALCSKFFRADRPCEISVDQLGKKLRQSGAQMRILSLILPFILRIKQGNVLKFAGQEIFLKCLLLLLKIMQLLLAYEFHDSDVERLRNMIKDFHSQLLNLAPAVNIAKLHFLGHLPDVIFMQGSIRQVSTFRFEGHHAYFKRLLKTIHNFVNPMLTLSTRHQTKQCRQMMKDSYLYSGHEFTVKSQVYEVVERNVILVKDKFPNCKTIQELSRLKIHGTVYQKESLILLSKTEAEFAEIIKIYKVDEKEFCFVCTRMSTSVLDPDVGAYCVHSGVEKFAVNALEIAYPHQVISLKYNGLRYAIPMGHRTLLS